MQRRLFLDIVVRERATVLKLLPCKNESLLIWRDPFLVLDASFDVFDRICWLDLQCDRLTRECLDKNLHIESVGC